VEGVAFGGAAAMTDDALTKLRQLPLPFAHAPHFEGTAFLRAPSNQAALAWLQPGTHWPQSRMALWGPEGSGKTHLLHLWATGSGARLLHGPGLRFSTLMAGLHDNLAIDDADAAPERDLLHLLNAAQEAGLHVLMAARTPPARWPVALADLGSRLRATIAVELLPPDDELLRALLARLLAERQIVVPEAVQDWLRLRLPRTSATMREAAARLDRLALAAGGPVTRALAARVLADLGDANDTEQKMWGEKLWGEKVFGDTVWATDEDLTSTGAAASPAPPRLL
jgi:chromosomal replication initiation ATPase DnaA